MTPKVEIIREENSKNSKAQTKRKEKHLEVITSRTLSPQTSNYNDGSSNTEGRKTEARVVETDEKPQ